MRRRYPYADYTPDLPPLVNQGLTVAKNVVPRRGGFGQQLGPSVLSDFTALEDFPRGSIAFVDEGGIPHNFAGTAAKLYRLSTSTEDVSRTTGGPYSASDIARWEFAVFGQTIVAVNPNDETQYYTVPTSTEFAELSSGAPRARHIGLVGRHLVLGNTFDIIDGHVPNRIWWPAIGDPFTWPAPGTDAAVQVQSDFSDLEGNGGWVQRVISGAEVGAVFQERAIWRMDYIGTPAIYQLTRVEPNRGLLIPGICLPVSRWIFFCSEDGFYIFDYTASRPIGKDRIDSTFLADADSAFYHRISAAVDPDEQRVYVLYPGSGNVAGKPNKWLCWDWSLDRFTHGEFDAEWITPSLDPGVTLDSAPVFDMDAAVLAMDTRQSPTGALRLGVYNDSHRLAQLTGTALTAILESGDLELTPSRRSMLSLVRPLVRGGKTTVQVAGKGRYDQAIDYGPERSVDEDGDAAYRLDARYHRVRVKIEHGFDEAIGFDTEFVKTGMR